MKEFTYNVEVYHEDAAEGTCVQRGLIALHGLTEEDARRGFIDDLTDQGFWVRRFETVGTAS